MDRRARRATTGKVDRNDGTPPSSTIRRAGIAASAGSPDFSFREQ
jgi:hypothetical protein